MAANPENQTEIIERIRHLMQTMRMTQAQFAARIKVSAANMSKHLSGKLPVTIGLVNRIALDFGVSKTWLLDGSDLPFAKHEGDHAMLIPERAVNPSTPARRRGVPVYDLDVTAGFGELSRMFTDDRVMGYVDLPQFQRTDNVRIARVTGDSMEPAIANGGFIALREVQSSTLFWGQIYVVILEDYRMVKIVRRHNDPGKIILHSVNPEYDDIEINRDEVIGLYLVEAILNYTQRC